MNGLLYLALWIVVAGALFELASSACNWWTRAKAEREATLRRYYCNAVRVVVDYELRTGQSVALESVLVPPKAHRVTPFTRPSSIVRDAERLRGMADDVRRHSRCAEARIGLLATDDLLQPQRS